MKLHISCLLISIFWSTFISAQTDFMLPKIVSCVKQNTDSISLPKYLEECMLNIEFPFFCVEDVAQKTYCTDEFEEHYLLNYWFEDCPGCKTEKPYLERLSKAFPNLEIISLSRDSEESFDEIKSKKLDWICVADYENKGIPHTSAGYPLSIDLNIY